MQIRLLRCSNCCIMTPHLPISMMSTSVDAHEPAITLATPRHHWLLPHLRRAAPVFSAGGHLGSHLAPGLGAAVAFSITLHRAAFVSVARTRNDPGSLGRGAVGLSYH